MAEEFKEVFTVNLQLGTRRRGVAQWAARQQRQLNRKVAKSKMS